MLTILAISILSSSCCSNCKECSLTLKYEWKIPKNGIDIVNMKNDTLIGSEIYSGEKYSQHVKDSGHFVINKTNGEIVDSIFGFVPKSADMKYISRVGQTQESSFIFTTRTSQFVVAENHKGYKIVLQEWYKNIRHENNTVYNVLVFKEDKNVSEICLPNIYDFTYDNNSIYINSHEFIYKFNFDEIIKEK